MLNVKKYFIFRIKQKWWKADQVYRNRFLNFSTTITQHKNALKCVKWEHKIAKLSEKRKE